MIPSFIFISTGALVVDGGAGIARDLYVGAGLSVTGIQHLLVLHKQMLQEQVL